MTTLLRVPSHVMASLAGDVGGVIGHEEEGGVMIINGYRLTVVEGRNVSLDCKAKSSDNVWHAPVIGILRHAYRRDMSRFLSTITNRSSPRRCVKRLKTDPVTLRFPESSTSAVDKKKYAQITPEEIKSRCFKIFELHKDGRVSKQELLQELGISEHALKKHFLTKYTTYDSKTKTYMFSDVRLRIALENK
jgi:hypothetical protein